MLFVATVRLDNHCRILPTGTNLFYPILFSFESEMKTYCRKQVVFWDTDNRGFLLIFSPPTKMFLVALVLAGGLLTDA